MLKVNLEINLRQVHRLWVSAASSLVICCTAFYSANFVTATIKHGITKTYDTFMQSFTRTFDATLRRVEALSLHAEDMGPWASVVKRVPYLQAVRQYVNVKGALIKMEFDGVNLDQLEGISASSYAFYPQEGDERTRDSFRASGDYDETLVVLVSDGAVQLDSLDPITFQGPGTVKNRFVLPIDYEDADRDSIWRDLGFDDQGSKRGGSSKDPDHPGQEGTGAGRINPIPVAATPEPEQPVAPIELIAEYQGIIDKYAFENLELYESLTARTARGTVAYSDVAQLLYQVHGSGTFSSEMKNQAFHDILFSGIVLRPIGKGALHSTTPENLDLLVKRLGRGRFLELLDQVGQLRAGISNAQRMLTAIDQREKTEAEELARVQSARQEGPDRDVGPQPSDSEEYLELYNKDDEFVRCMTVIESVKKAHEAFSSNMVTKPKLDVEQLRMKGYLSYLPICPNGKPYVLDDRKMGLTCPVHGSRSRPWREHDRYVKWFREYDEARRLAFKENDYRQALRTLAPYFERNRENSLARALLTDLLFRVRKFKDALRFGESLGTKYSKNVRFQFILGFSFYTQDNLILARRYLDPIVKLKPETFDFSLVSDLTSFDYFLMQDVAMWCRANMMDLENATLEERKQYPGWCLDALGDAGRSVSYAEFTLKPEPEYPSRVCFEQVKALIDFLPDLSEIIRPGAGDDSNSRYGRLRESLATLKQDLANTPKYEEDKIRSLNRDRDRDRRLLDRVLDEDLDSLLQKADPGIGPCPAGGYYYCDDAYNVQCTVHRNILDGSRMKAAENRAVSTWERTIFAQAFIRMMRGTIPAFYDCWWRQCKVLRAGFQVKGQPGRFQVPDTGSLEELIQMRVIEKSDAFRDATERLQITIKGDRGLLECSNKTHLSAQRALETVVNDGEGEHYPFENLYLDSR